MTPSSPPNTAAFSAVLRAAVLGGGEVARGSTVHTFRSKTQGTILANYMDTQFMLNNSSFNNKRARGGGGGYRLADRWGLSGYFSEEFVKKILFLSQVITFFVT